MKKIPNETAPGGWNDKERILTECIRIRPLLRQIAQRLLDGRDDPEKAVNRCIVRATKTYVEAQSLGEFRSWIFRLAIDESLKILSEHRAAAEANQRAIHAKDSRENGIPMALLFARWMMVGVAD